MTVTIDHSPLQLSKNEQLVSQMAEVYAVDADSVPVYIQYFDISLLPATVFFFNGQHMKVDWGSVLATFSGALFRISHSCTQMFS